MKNKLITTLCLAALLLTGFLGNANVAKADATMAKIHVTICDGVSQTPVLAYKEVSVKDVDGDGAITINDALITAHKENYKDGESGYGSADGDYGLYISKLWGIENGGSYGYYVNNASAWSLTDPVNDGDHLAAFVYSDLTYWSDTYSYFDTPFAQGDKNTTINLVLSAASFDADYNPVTLPVAGAVITVNGEETQLKTDENGAVAINLKNDLKKDGEYVISAKSADMTLVPPVCVITYANEQVNFIPYIIGGVVVLLIVVCVVVLTKKKNNK